MQGKSDFKSISLKTELVEEIEEFIKNNKRYRSIAEFVSEAARLRLEELQRIKEAPNVK
ncbi:MAG: ribbon-helix-helix domain-containing protein [Candidatus Bathyarchaeota archaeon]|nr:ribbon-helix-helix domain-containing protein [Candidatus Bathyarchaeota archaeon]MDH5786748.1 ribbon-helix-helix domain-containing protein [Candidatus Bathyarchaeota archaeon]